MDASAIAGSALLMKTAQTQQAISISMMKQAADQQKLMAELLAKNTAQIPQPSNQSSNGTFSTYA
jgi:hypothetical protein